MSFLSTQITSAFFGPTLAAVALLAFSHPATTRASIFDAGDPFRADSFDPLDGFYNQLFSGDFALACGGLVFVRSGARQTRQQARDGYSSSSYVPAQAAGGLNSTSLAQFSTFDVSLLAANPLGAGDAAVKTRSSATSAAGGTSSTWATSPTSSNWVTSAAETNWSSGAGNYPGLTSGTTSTNQATFLTSNNVTVTVNANLNLKTIQFGNSSTAPNSFTIGGANSSSLMVTNAGSILQTSGFSGASNLTQVVSAPIVLEPNSSSTSGTYNFTNNAGTGSNVLQISGAISGGNTSQAITLTLSGSNTGGASLTGGNIVSGAITDGSAGAGVALNKDGAGTWTVSGSNGYTGGTTLASTNTGTLKVSGSGTLGSTLGSLAVNGGTLDLNGTNQTVGGLIGSGGSIINTSSATASTLTIGNGDATASYAGGIGLQIGTTLNLKKVGLGTETLTGLNSYNGTTTVAAGTLKLANTGGLALSGTSAVSINNGGTLLFGANNQILVSSPPTITLGSATGTGTAKIDAGGFSQGTGGTSAASPGTVGLGALTLSANSTIDMTGTSVLHFSNSSTQTWTAGATLSIYNWSGAPTTGGGSEQILFGTTVAGLTNSQLLQITFVNPSGFDPGNYFAVWAADGSGELVPSMTAVPEPGTWVAAGLSLTAIAWGQRRRIRRAFNKSAACQNLLL